MSTYWCFLVVLYPITYSNLNPDGFNQVNHLRKFILNSRQIDLDYTKISTIDDYWNWLENSFVENIRVEQWYNRDALESYIIIDNDESYVYEFGGRLLDIQSVGINVWKYNQSKCIGDLFKGTNRYVYINDLLIYLINFCCLFGTIKYRRLLLFIEHVGKDLLSFFMMFSIVFMAFLCLFDFQTFHLFKFIPNSRNDITEV